MNEFLGIALRISVMYLFALALLRLSGKRSIGDLTPLDFAVATIIGDMFDDVFWAEIPLSQGLVGITTILFLHTLVALADSSSHRIHRLIAGMPVQVINQGQVLEEGLARERISIEALWAGLREQGQVQEKLPEIKTASLEPSGEISMILQEAAMPVQKRDLQRLKELKK